MKQFCYKNEVELYEVIWKKVYNIKSENQVREKKIHGI